MPICFLPSRDATLQPAVFGKLPGEADFIRIGSSSHPAVLEFDALLARGLAYASRQPGWDEQRYLAAPPCDFLFSTHDRRWSYLGSLLPSRDRCGRMYPLVAGVILPAHAVLPIAPELVIANELFFGWLRDRLPSIHEAAALSAAYHRFLADQSAPSNASLVQDELNLAEQMLTRHLSSLTTSQLQARLAAASLPPLDDILMAFIFHVDTVRRLGTSAPKLTVPLPLSHKAGESALDQAAWLALHRASTSKGRTPDFIANRNQIIVAPSRFGERSLGALWGLPTEPIMIEPPPRRQGTWVDAAWALGKQVQDPNLTLDGLLPTLERIAGSLT